MSDEREIIRQSAGMIATALGDGWKVDTEADYTWQTVILGPSNERLYVSRGDKRHSGDVTRLAINAGLGHLARHDQFPYGLNTRHEITVSRDRGPEVIAREINRRLLPEYREAMAKVHEAVQRSENAAKLRAELAERLSGRVVTHQSGESQTTVSVPGGSIRINYEATSVAVDLYTCSPETAIALVELLRAEGGN